MARMLRRNRRNRIRRNRRNRRRLNVVKRQHTARNAVGHLFKRVAYLENYIGIEGGGVGNKTIGAMTFSLDQLPAYTDFTQLYDLYKINKVRVQFIPKMSSAVLADSAQMPVVHTIIDSNDSSNPTFIEMMQNEDLKTTRGTVLHTRYFTPKCQLKLYESLATDGYAAARRNPFISTNDPSVPHYALKWVIENPITGGSAYWYCDVKVTYYLALREVQ